MKCTPGQAIQTALLLVVLVFSGSIWWSLRSIHQGLQNVITHESTAMQTVSSTVTNGAGTTFTITTPRSKNSDGTDEALAAWLQRHQAAVTEFQNS